MLTLTGAQVYTTAALTTPGLVGSYVNQSLQNYAPQDDWRSTQTISGTRVDAAIDFPTTSFGSRSAVGITGGTNADWDNFSVQWDGYIKVTAANTRFATKSDDGSRMWIDLNGDGVFAPTGPEFIDNHWGQTQGDTTGDRSVPLSAGVYVLDSRTLQSTPESGGRAGYDGAKRRKGSKTHVAVDTLGHLLALRVTPASDGDRNQVGKLAKDVQEATSDSVEVAFVDQGYTGPKPEAAARRAGIELSVVKLPEAKRGFVLLPRRWVVERTFAWAARFRRLARDYERLPETLAGLHFVAFACLMVRNLMAGIT